MRSSTQNALPTGADAVSLTELQKLSNNEVLYTEKFSVKPRGRCQVRQPAAILTLLESWVADSNQSPVPQEAMMQTAVG